jgi:replication factor A3
MGDVTPRINASYLETFANGQTIRIVGKVTQLRGDQATIDANGPIIIHLNRVGFTLPRCGIF